MVVYFRQTQHTVLKLSGTPLGALRVLRGGSWNNTSNNVRSANRNNNDNGNNNIGFRVVCSPISLGIRKRQARSITVYLVRRIPLNGAGVSGLHKIYQAVKLQFHEHNAQVSPVTAGIPWLGFVVYPTHRHIKKRNVVNATRRLRSRYQQWQEGGISFAEFDAGVQGWINHVRYADSWGLRKKVLWEFKR